jgi:hypothetical protein
MLAKRRGAIPAFFFGWQHYRARLNLLIIYAPARNESLHARLMAHTRQPRRVNIMNSIIYIVGLIVIVMAILSFIGLA